MCLSNMLKTLTNIIFKNVLLFLCVFVIVGLFNGCDYNKNNLGQVKIQPLPTITPIQLYSDNIQKGLDYLKNEDYQNALNCFVSKKTDSDEYQLYNYCMAIYVLKSGIKRANENYIDEPYLKSKSFESTIKFSKEFIKKINPNYNGVLSDKINGLQKYIDNNRYEPEIDMDYIQVLYAFGVPDEINSIEDKNGKRFQYIYRNLDMYLYLQDEKVVLIQK